LVLQQKASGVVKPFRSDEVEGQHVRIRDNPRARGGAAELEESAAVIPHSHDVHAVSIRVWTCEHLFAVFLPLEFVCGTRAKSSRAGTFIYLFIYFF